MENSLAFAVVLACFLLGCLWRDLPLLLRMTRNWLHYGWLIFVILLVTVSAIEGMANR